MGFTKKQICYSLQICNNASEKFSAARHRSLLTLRSEKAFKQHLKHVPPLSPQLDMPASTFFTQPPLCPRQWVHFMMCELSQSLCPQPTSLMVVLVLAKTLPFHQTVHPKHPHEWASFWRQKCMLVKSRQSRHTGMSTAF